MKLIDADKLIDRLKSKIENAEQDYRLTDGSVKGMVARGQIRALEARGQIRALERVLEAIEEAVAE